MHRSLLNFFRHDAFGGILLLVATVLALIVANSSLAPVYRHVLGLYGTVSIGESGISKPLILWINDGLMAIFFLYVGLELKRELREGKLKNPRDVILPGAAALGGMAVPMLVFLLFNFNNPETLRGLAIPAATDIAFALGVLAIVGSRLPSAIKVFLLTLAILDDLGAILIIAIFYTDGLKVDYLYLSLIPIGLMLWLNLRGTHRTAPFMLLGAVLWVMVLKSGVHATLAGVITAFMIPIKDKYGKSPLHSMEHGLEPYVLYLIMPIFAFANAGIDFSTMNMESLFSGLTMGVALGLLIGKIVGVTGGTYAIVRSGFAQLPYGMTWRHVLGVSALAGIGFTMSIFLATLSYTDNALVDQARLGVMLGSLSAGILGGLILFLAPVGDEDDQADDEESELAQIANDQGVTANS